MAGDKLRVTLYRGLGLPEKAIQVYHAYLKSDDTFQFTGFTSTSYDGQIAMKFAYQAAQKNKELVPVLFIMNTGYSGGC